MPKHRLTLRFPMEAIAVLFLLLAPVSEASTAEPITYGNLVTRLAASCAFAQPLRGIFPNPLIFWGLILPVRRVI